MPKVVDPEEQRERVIDAAREVILVDGLDGATMRRIASKARCTTGLVTHYFTSKEDLLLTVVRHNARRAGGRISNALVDRHGIDAVRAVLIESTPISNDHAEEWRIWVALWDRAMSNARLTAEWTRRAEGWQSLVRNGLHEAVETKELVESTPIELLVEGLSAFHFGLSLSAVMMPNRPPVSRLIGALEHQLSLICWAHGRDSRGLPPFSEQDESS